MDVLYAPRLFDNEQSTEIKKLVGSQKYVFVSPPFGGRLLNDENKRFRRSEELFLDFSFQVTKPNGRIVVMVPEGLLFSSSSAGFRDYIVEKTWIRAIISLEQFLPRSGVKASILVLDKKSRETIGGDILMCKITGKDVINLSESNLSIFFVFTHTLTKETRALVR